MEEIVERQLKDICGTGGPYISFRDQSKRAKERSKAFGRWDPFCPAPGVPARPAGTKELSIGMGREQSHVSIEYAGPFIKELVHTCGEGSETDEQPSWSIIGCDGCETRPARLPSPGTAEDDQGY